MENQIAKASMLISCSVMKVFDAFVDPNKITRFWLDAASAPLVKGAEVNWTFKVPGATETVTVTDFQDQSRIGFKWSDGVKVLITFQEYGNEATHISVEASGFNTDKGVDEIVNATEGFAIVLCDLKTLLENGRSANLVRDKATLIAASLSAKGDT